jgi:hypothetical protein
MLHGGMTLQLTAVQHSHLHHSAAGSGHQDSSSSGDGSSIGSGSSSSERSISVCILQVVPWYVRVWLHTLRLTIDGQVGGWALLSLSSRHKHTATVFPDT